MQITLTQVEIYLMWCAIAFFATVVPTVAYQIGKTIGFSAATWEFTRKLNCPDEE